MLSHPFLLGPFRFTFLERRLSRKGAPGWMTEMTLSGGGHLAGLSSERATGNSFLKCFLHPLGHSVCPPPGTLWSTQVWRLPFLPHPWVPRKTSSHLDKPRCRSATAPWPCLQPARRGKARRTSQSALIGQEWPATRSEA